MPIHGEYAVGSGAPIDWGWEWAQTLSEVLAKIGDADPRMTQTLWEMKALLPTEDITEGPVVVWVPSSPDFDPLLVIKEYDNGTVTVVGNVCNSDVMTEMGFAPTWELESALLARAIENSRGVK